MRYHLRQEPSAVVLHAGICAGGRHNGGPYRNPGRFDRPGCRPVDPPERKG